MAEPNNSTNRFIAGMNQDVHPINQPENTTRRVVNFVPLTKSGNLYALSNEDGTLLCNNITFPNNLKVIGQTVLNTEIIVVLANDAGNSAVGIIKMADYSFQLVAPVLNGIGAVSDNSEFGFSVDYPVDVVARKLINGHRVLYYTDNHVPFGRVDLDAPPVVGEVVAQAALQFNQKIPNINLTAILEGQGSNTPAGSYFFVTRYVTKNGNTTQFGIPIGPIPLVKSLKSVGINAYEGSPIIDNTGKAIQLSISNIDTNFAQLEVFAITYSGAQSAFTMNRFSTRTISSDTQTVIYAGAVENEIAITQEELNKVFASYTHAKCIEQKDGILHLSNLRDESAADDVIFQKIANDIIVKYNVNEIVYSGRGEDENYNLNTFTLVTSPQIYTIIGGNKNGIALSFNGVVTTIDFVTLRKNGTVATANISFGVNPTNGDTITIDSVVYTAKTTPSLTNDFKIGATATDTAINFTDLVNALTYFYKAPSTIGVNVQLQATTPSISDNGKVVLSSNSSITTSNFSGASTAITDYTKQYLNPADTASFNISGNTIIVDFTSFLGGVMITNADTVQIGEVTSPKTVDGVTDPSGSNYVSAGFLPVTDVIVTTPIPSGDAGFSDYINEPLTLYSKGYMRNEVYSLGYFVIFNDGSLSVNYHIPGYEYPTMSYGKNANPNWSNNKVGTYLSTATYPSNQGYPGLLGSNIKHHLMPPLSVEPSFKNDGTNQYIRILNLEFTNVVIPPEIANKIQGIVFTRERRNSIGNASILGQGIINRSVESADAFVGTGGNVDKWPVSGSTIDGVRTGYNMMEIPLLNNLEHIVTEGGNPNKYGAYAFGGMAYPGISFGYTSYADGTRLNTLLKNNQVWFHSPDNVLNIPTLCTGNNVLGGNLSQELLLIGDAVVANFGQDTIRTYDSQFGNASYQLDSYLFFDLFCNYNNYNIDTGTPNVIKEARDVLAGSYKAKPIDSTRSGWRTSSYSSQGGLEMLVTDNVTDPGGDKLTGHKATADQAHASYTHPEVTHYDGYSYLTNDTTGYPVGFGSKLQIKNYLYNIEKTNPQQYGDIGQGGYIPIGRFVYDGTSYSCFGGDTFITKFAMNTGQIIPYWPLFFKNGWLVGLGDQNIFIGGPETRALIGKFDGAGSQSTASKTGRSTGYLHADGAPVNGWDFRATSFFFVESIINTNYRYREFDDSGKPGANYYPHNNNRSNQLNDWIAPLGNSIGYNAQYSFDNSAKLYYTRNASAQILSAFETRDIYSEQAKNDDILDTYQVLLPGNYYDLPSNTGMIWDSFVHMNTLYFHTPKGLWATFAEPAATLQANDISDVVLGTGGLFVRPSQLILTSQGGYAGSISQFGGINSSMGYIFPDVLQRKHFVLGGSSDGPQLKDLTEQGLYTFYKDNVTIDETLIKTKTSNQIDNPYNGIGFIGGYDFNLKRAIITFHGASPFTLSFSTITGNWISFHDYIPNAIIQFNNQTILVDNTGTDAQVYLANEGNKGEFFGVVYPSLIQWVVNGPGAKIFSNIVIMSETYVGDLLVRDDNFKTIQVWSDRMNSGVRNIINGNVFDPIKSTDEVFVKFRNDQYRVALPRDAVKDNSLDIFNAANLYTPMGTVPTDDYYYFKERIKGNYIHVECTYDNTSNRNFILNFIQSIFGQNIR